MEKKAGAGAAKNLVKLLPKSVGQVNSTLFKLKVNCPIEGSLRNHSDKSENVLRMFKLYFCLFQKNLIILIFFLFGFSTIIIKQIIFDK